MKKIIAVMLCLLLGLCFFTACGESDDDDEPAVLPDPDPMSGERFPIAMIVNGERLRDYGINLACWGGIQTYGEEYGIYYQFYKAKEATEKAYMNSIAEAVKAEAEMIVLPGSDFRDLAVTAATKYVDIHFILVDNTTSPPTERDPLPANVYAISFAEEEAGFLAGYAIVSEGFRELGFIGGPPDEGTMNYGYGFLQGAEYAANIKRQKVTVRYLYTGLSGRSSAAEMLARTWYEDGCEVIFASDPLMARSVIRAAKECDGLRKEQASRAELRALEEAEYYSFYYVIAGAYDLSSRSYTLFTSAMEYLGNGVYDGLFAYYEDIFPAGEERRLDAAVKGVTLPMSVSRFVEFSNQDYRDIYAKLMNGTVNVNSSDEIADIADLSLKWVHVDHVTGR